MYESVWKEVPTVSVVVVASRGDTAAAIEVNAEVSVDKNDDEAEGCGDCGFELFSRVFLIESITFWN